MRVCSFRGGDLQQILREIVDEGAGGGHPVGLRGRPHDLGAVHQGVDQPAYLRKGAEGVFPQADAGEQAHQVLDGHTDAETAGHAAARGDVLASRLRLHGLLPTVP